MKRRLSFKKRRTSSSSIMASASDVEDRVVMLCEDIPSEDSGWGSQSPGAGSSGDSQTGYGPDWSSVSHLPERDLRQIHGGFRTDELSMCKCVDFVRSLFEFETLPALGIHGMPRLIDMGKVYRQSNMENLEQAFSVAERELGVTRLLDPEDVDVPHPDEKSIITYVSSLYDAMPRVPDVQDGAKVNALEVHWHEYYELVTILLQWIRHHILIFEERKFPSSYEEVEILWRQFLKFKETELPAKESDKSHSKHLYQSFESAVHAGQVKVPPGFHPIDVEKEWGRLHVAILERERLLRIEFERLERLQQIVRKVQVESGMCEEQLKQTESLLQTDIRLLNARKPAQHTVEVERDLDKADGMIRLLFNDVQLLKDGRHLQGEQMVYHLHERLVNLRSDYNLRLKSSISTVSHVSITSHEPVQRARPELDEVTLRYAQDLLSWVEENQRRIDTAEWGIDLPSVESQLGSHRGLQQTIEDFRAKIERARTDENQLSPLSKGTYREYLGKLDLQYNRLLNNSKFRLRNLDQLYNFVSAATKELMWLNDKEEEEINYDWSERNTNMAAKKENYSGLMRELELREKKINDIQATGDRLIKDGHPGKKTVETQWSWILQVCCCIETHLKENTAYFQFFADVRDAEERMKKMQETMKKKYMCDRSTTSTRLEDLLQDAVEEREQLNEFKSDVASLNKRAKSIVQLKPRDPTSPFRGKLPIQAVCDFKQIAVTCHTRSQSACAARLTLFLLTDHHGTRATSARSSITHSPSGEVLNARGRGAVHLLPRAARQQGGCGERVQFKTMKTDEYQLMLRNLQLHYQDFLKDGQDSKLFDSSDNIQIERDYKETVQHYDSLLRTLEKGAAVRAQGRADESIMQAYYLKSKTSAAIEDCDPSRGSYPANLWIKIRSEDCHSAKLAIQKKVHIELEGIKKNLDRVSQKAEEVLSSPEQSSTPVLRSELDITLQKMDQTYNLSSVYLEKLKTIEIVIRNTQGAEDVVKKYENRLREVHTVPTNVQEVENYSSELKRMRSEAETQRPVFDDMESELAKATAVSHRMLQVHCERDAELDHYRQLLGSLQDRWRAVFAQIDLRQRELEQLGRQLGYYRESYDWLIRWIADAKQRQERIQAVPIIDSKTLKEQLAQEKKLLEEIEKNKEKVDECQKYAKAYIDTIKDYELQLVAYKAHVEPLTSPLKKTKMESASDNVIQEYVTLRTRYSELMTLTSQYIKFITDTQRRIEDEEKAAEKLKAEERKKMAEMQAELEKQKQLAEAHAKAIAKAEKEAQELKLMMQQEVSKREIVAVDAERQKRNIQLELHELKNLSEQQMKSKSQQVEEALQSRVKIEEEIRIIRLQLETTLKQKSTAEDELRQLRDKAAEAERLRKVAHEEAEKLRKQVNEETQKKRMAEEELKLKSEAEKEAARQKQKALDELAKHKMQAEEAERHMKQAEIEKARQIKLAQDAAQKSAAAELQSKRMSYVEKTSKLEESLREKHGTVVQLQEEAERLKKHQEEADNAREEAEKELEKWRQKANEALRLRLQAEEEAHKKTLAQEEAEKQKDEAEREAKKRAKAEESALKQKDMAEQELERQRKLAESTAQQKLSAEQELIRLRADFDHAEQQRSLLDDELYRLKNEITEKESMSTTEKKKLSAINEATRLKTEAEIALKEKEAENERLRRQAEDEAYQRKALEDQATQHKQDIHQKIEQLKKSSEMELDRQKSIVDDTLKQKRIVEEEIRILKVNFEKASSGKLDLELELNKLKNIAEETQQSKLRVEEEAEKLRKLALHEENRRREAEEKLKKITAAEQEAARQCQSAQGEVERLKKKADEARKQKEDADKEAERQILAAREAAEKAIAAEHQVHNVLVQQKEDSLVQKKLKEEFEKAKKLAQEAEKAKEKAEKEAALLRQQAEDAERQRQAAEVEAANQAKAQEAAERLRKEAELEAEKRAQAEASALKQKQLADEEMARHKTLAEQTLKQKSQDEVSDAVKQKAQRDKDNTQKFLAEEAENMKKLAEEAARLSIETQEAARMRHIAETDLAEQRALAEKMLKEKMQAIQEASKLRAEAEMLQRQKDLAQEQAQKLLEDKQLMQQRLEEETEGFQKSLEAERRRQLEITAEAEKLRLQVSQLSDAQSRAEEEAKKFKKQADRLSSNKEADDLRKAIADLEKEKAKLKKEAEELQKKSKEIVNAQQEQIKQEKTILQQTFMSEKEMLLKKEKQIEDEKKRLENQFEEEVKKSKALKDEQERQRKQMEDEKIRLKATMDAALIKQKEAEQEMLNKQKEMHELERKRLEQERILAEENQKLREKLQQLEVAQKINQEIHIQTEFKKVLNGQSISDDVDSTHGFSPLSFDGIREKVPASRLFEIGLLSKMDYDKLQSGDTTVEELSQTNKLKTVLEGKNCIGGLLVHPNQKMPIYQAVKEKKIAPGTGLVLLEAQAASGYIIDPVKNKKLSVNEAVKEGLIGPELHNKMLSAERAVTGYKDPYTEAKISLFEAMKKGLIGEDHAIRLLEAQIATGGIIDPVNSHRVPNEIAYKQGQFDVATSKILQNPTDDVKGFYDPNTQENMMYQQLIERIFTDEETRDVFDKTTVSVPFGRFKGKTVTIWEIINSEYFTEDQKKDLIRQYKTGKITVERIIRIVLTVAEEKEKKNELAFDGLRAPVPATKLLESKIIDKDLYNKLQKGQLLVKEVSEMEHVRNALKGTKCIAGVIINSTKQTMSFYDAMKRDMMRPGPALNLLEAQAATGYVVDPVKNQQLTVDEAVKAGVVGPELHEKLLSAERAVTGYKDPYTGKTISLFEAMKKDLIMKEQGIRLLDAQLATGGIIDPVQSHRIPHDIACMKGCFDDATHKFLTSPSDEVKGYFDPNTQEYLTYPQLYKRCVTDKKTGLQLLPLSEQAINAKEEMKYTDAQTKDAMTQAAVEVQIGPFKGRKSTYDLLEQAQAASGFIVDPSRNECLTVDDAVKAGQGSMSLWDVMNSNLLPEDQRARLLEEYRSGSLTKERMIIIIIEILEQKEIIKGGNTLTGSTRRRQITIEDLYNARIIDLETYNLLKKDKKTMRDVMEMQSVKQYLYGTGSVAGVLTDSNSKISIYQAMRRELLKPDIAIALLEAQAATGFIIDPVRNEMLTVDEAVCKGVVGPELHDKLLSAERAVTGYKDPYSGKVISLFQAMKKDLVPEDYALRLLEAQIATGGIIDPEYNFHLPTEIATQRGHINKETNEKLSDEVKGYVDPLTDEKVSYSQLLKRSKLDKDGVYLLSLGERRLIFKGLRKEITIEELFHSKIIDEQTISKLYEGLLTMEEVSNSLRKYLEGTSCIAGVFVESTKDRLSIYQAMKKNMIRPGTAFELLEAQAATGYIIDPIKNLKLTVNEAAKMGIVGPEFKDKLLSAERAVTGYRDPYTGKMISLFQAMKKGLILRDHGIRLLEAQIATGGIIDPEQSHRLPVEVAYNRGFFDEEMNEILSDPSDDTKGFFDPNSEENLTYLQLMDRCIIDPDTGLVLLLLKEKKRETKTSSKSSVRKRRVVIVDPDSGKEMSVYEAYRKGLIDHQTYIELSEQECEWEEITMTSSEGVEKSILIDRRSGRQYDIDDAIAKGLIDQSAIEQYRSGTLSITEFADMLSGNMSGFRSRSSSFGSTSSYPMSPIPSIKTPATVWNDPTEETGPVAGILDTDSLEKVSISEAMRRNLVDSITGQRLLEAQACTGGIIDPCTGEKFSVAEATEKGLIDKIMVDRLNLAQKSFHGFEDPRTKVKMSAAQALKKGWLYYEAGQRFLEVQYLTGGLIEPEVEGRISLEEAIVKGSIDGRTAQKLRDVSAYSKYLTCPKTKLKISYKDAMDRSMVEEESGLRLLEASSTSSKGLYSPYNVSGAASASGSRSGSRTGSRSGSRRGSFDATGSGFSMNFSSSSYTSSGYSRRF
ncbi:hypothetical protein cypCar_00014477 [Cyprinus carpio]|nr:hypothetical protein cypCar_00014477 [Cyprinus carpio]